MSGKMLPLTLDTAKDCHSTKMNELFLLSAFLCYFPPFLFDRGNNGKRSRDLLRTRNDELKRCMITAAHFSSRTYCNLLTTLEYTRKDFRRWDTVPRTSRFFAAPALVERNQQFLRVWFVGEFREFLLDDQGPAFWSMKYFPCQFARNRT